MMPKNGFLETENIEDGIVMENLAEVSSFLDFNLKKEFDKIAKKCKGFEENIEYDIRNYELLTADSDSLFEEETDFMHNFAFRQFIISIEGEESEVESDEILEIDLEAEESDNCDTAHFLEEHAKEHFDSPFIVNHQFGVRKCYVAIENLSNIPYLIKEADDTYKYRPPECILDPEKGLKNQNKNTVNINPKPSITNPPVFEDEVILKPKTSDISCKRKLNFDLPQGTSVPINVSLPNVIKEKVNKTSGKSHLKIGNFESTFAIEPEPFGFYIDSDIANKHSFKNIVIDASVHNNNPVKLSDITCYSKANSKTTSKILNVAKSKAASILNFDDRLLGESHPLYYYNMFEKQSLVKSVVNERCDQIVTPKDSVNKISPVKLIGSTCDTKGCEILNLINSKVNCILDCSEDYLNENDPLDFFDDTSYIDNKLSLNTKLVSYDNLGGLNGHLSKKKKIKKKSQSSKSKDNSKETLNKTERENINKKIEGSSLCLNNLKKSRSLIPQGNSEKTLHKSEKKVNAKHIHLPKDVNLHKDSPLSCKIKLSFSTEDSSILSSLISNIQEPSASKMKKTSKITGFSKHFLNESDPLGFYDNSATTDNQLLVETVKNKKDNSEETLNITEKQNANTTNHNCQNLKRKLPISTEEYSLASSIFSNVKENLKTPNLCNSGNITPNENASGNSKSVKIWSIKNRSSSPLRCLTRYNRIKVVEC